MRALALLVACAVLACGREPEHPRRWHLGTNDRLVVVQGYVGSVAFDLVRGISHVLMGKESETEVFSAIPAAELRVLMGRARGGGTDLFEVTIPHA